MIWYAVLASATLPADPVVGDPAIQALQSQLAAITPRVAVERTPGVVVFTLDLGRLTTRQLVVAASQLHALLPTSPLALTLGIAQNPIVAQLAAQAAPVGSGAIIPPGREVAFLAPLPITRLPIDPAITERLHAFGLRRIGDVARLSRSALQAQFGFAGLTLHDLAHGQASIPFLPLRDAPQVAIRRHFSGPVTNRLALEAALTRIAALLAVRLAQQGWSTRQLTLIVEAEDAPDVVASQALAAPTSDVALLTGALRQLLGTCLPDTGVLALRVVAGDLTKPQTAQLTLFPEPVISRSQVATVVASLSPRVRGQIYQAQLIAPQARCPEQQVALLPWEGG